MITYNLVLKDLQGILEIPSAAGIDGSRGVLTTLLTKWNDRAGAESSPYPSRLLYRLEHQYSDASLRYDALKGVDATKARALRAAVDDAPASVCLANIERVVRGDEDYDVDVEDETSLEMRLVVTLEGEEIGTKLSCEEFPFVQHRPYEDRDADESEHEGYSGNEGAPVTHTYRDTVRYLRPGRLWCFHRSADSIRYWPSYLRLVTQTSY